MAAGGRRGDALGRRGRDRTGKGTVATACSHASQNFKGRELGLQVVVNGKK